MKRILLISAFVCTLCAQTVITNIDWRYRLTWSDPNPAGMVANWIVYATNTTGMRSIGAATTTCDLLPLLNGAAAGTYTLYTTAVSGTGAVGDPGDTVLVQWPGGNGKPRGGHGLTVVK